MKSGPEAEKPRLRRKNGPPRCDMGRKSDGGKGKTRAAPRVCAKCGAPIPSELDEIAREAGRGLDTFSLPEPDFKFPEVKWPELPKFDIPELDLSGVLEPLPHYSGPVWAEVVAPGPVKCRKCGGAVRVAEVGGGRFAVQSAGAPVCEACAVGLPGGAALVRALAGVFPKEREKAGGAGEMGEGPRRCRPPPGRGCG